MAEVKFEQWELDQLHEELYEMGHRVSISYSPGHDDRWFAEFLNHVVEVSDKNRARNIDEGVPNRMPEERGCSEIGPRGFICTRVDGHQGDHAARGRGPKVLERWPKNVLTTES